MNIERLKALFEFNNGVLINKVSRGKAKKGELAGYVAEDGYCRVRIDGKYYYIHKIVWAMHHGEIPTGVVDHKDCDKTNNDISNLRLATQLTNQYNKTRQKDGTSKYKGVWYDAKKRVWKASIRLPDKRLYLGQFSSELEAARVYDEFAIEIHGEFAKLNLTGSE